MAGDISRINWVEHDGVNLAMINDLLRNRFYDRLLARHVPGQRCIDIGFGTGLLSMIALQHGASNIIAFESDVDRYELGRAVINELGLQQHIDLQYDRFDHTFFKKYPNHVVYTETVNGTLFQEGLKQSLPRYPRDNFIPGKYFMEIYSIPISWNLATGIAHDIGEPKPFSPGIDVDKKFIDVVNRYRQQANKATLSNIPQTDLPTGLHEFSYQIATAWGYDPHLAMVRAMPQSQAGYQVNAEHCTLATWNGQNTTTTDIDFEQDSITFQIDLPPSDIPICLVPRAGMAHESDKLMLDEGHWGPTPRPILSIGQRTVWINHNLTTGALQYSTTRI